MADKRVPTILEMRRAGMTYPEIGAAFQVSPERVRQLVGGRVTRDQAWRARRREKAITDGKLMGPSQEQLDKRAKLAKRNREMLRLWRKGATFVAIGKLYGISYVAARKAILKLDEELRKEARRAARR